VWAADCYHDGMFKSVLSVAFASALAVSSFGLAGCSGSDSSAPTDSTANDPTGEDDLTKALSPDMICATSKAFDDLQGDPTSLKSVAQKSLKGDALKDFKEFQKGMAGDYPSEAYELPVPFKGKKYTFLLVWESNDGGMYAGVYRTDGRTVFSFSQSESGEPSYSAPADKCNHD
jgi:hypothetical protein